MDETLMDEVLINDGGFSLKEEQKFKLKKLIKQLAGIRGRHTELVSVYIPAGYSIVDVTSQLKAEQSTAANIKSKTTRKNVLSALEKIIQHLKVFKRTPENGLVVFCGNVSAVEGREDIRMWSFEPPVRMKTKVYWCDQVFVLEPLKEFVREKELYGLIVLDAREGNVGLLRGKAVESLKHMESTVMSKTVKGGMSQHRYDRIREEAIHEFLTKVGEAASELLLKEKLKGLIKGLIIGGPGPIKDRFAKGDYLHYQLKKMLLGVKDTSYTGAYGLEELVNRAEDLIKKTAIVKERLLLEKFFAELGKGGLAVYGTKEVRHALEAGAADKLLISEGFDFVHAKLRCDCGFTAEKDFPASEAEEQLCERCGKKLVAEQTKDLIDDFVEKAGKTGTKVELISTDTREGIQFKELGGIGALLRFKLS